MHSIITTELIDQSKCAIPHVRLDDFYFCILIRLTQANA